MNKPTRTKETEKQYYKKGKQLYDAFLSSVDKDKFYERHSEIYYAYLDYEWRNWDLLTDFCKDLASNVKVSTWRKYKASICFYLEVEEANIQSYSLQYSLGDDPEAPLEDIRREIRDIKGNPDYREIKTSAKKKKSVPSHDLEKLVRDRFHNTLPNQYIFVNQRANRGN